jgi:hypothetical protein
MIKTILAWITGKSDKPAEAPYKIEPQKVEAMPLGTEAVMVAPEAVVPEAIVPAAAIETAPVTVKAKYKKADLTKMTKAELMELVTKHSLEVKARSTKEELVKVLAKV